GIVTRRHEVRKGRTAHIAGVDLDRHIRTVAQLTGNRGTTDISTEADAIQADIFRVLEEVTSETQGSIDTFYCTWSRATLDIGVDGSAAMVVQGIEAKLGIVQLGHEPAHRHTELSAITGVLVFACPHDVGSIGTQVRMLEAVRQTRMALRKVWTEPD